MNLCTLPDVAWVISYCKCLLYGGMQFQLVERFRNRKLRSPSHDGSGMESRNSPIGHDQLKSCDLITQAAHAIEVTGLGSSSASCMRLARCHLNERTWDWQLKLVRCEFETREL